MDISSATTPLAAFAAGVVTSVHCTGMCGPLTCAMFGSCGRRELRAATTFYHVARIVSYSLLGGLLGFIGRPAAAIFSSDPARVVPWAFAVVFLFFAFGLEKRMPQPAFISKIFSLLKIGPSHSTGHAALLGAATPFLPCGPLYLLFGVALLTSSFFDGAKLMASFALGTLPLYWLVQLQWVRLQSHFSPAGLVRVQRGLACASAGLLIWRAAANAGLGLAHAACH
jgi:sulfite exporter TauE/SafE